MKSLYTLLTAFMLSLFSLTISAQSTQFSHTVKGGETLTSIAAMYGTSVQRIQQLNPGIKEMIHVGDVLNIPRESKNNGNITYHTIASGETLYRITKMYSVTADELCRANPGLSADNFKAGTVIVIPAANQQLVSAAQNKQQQYSEGKGVKKIHKVKSKETIYGIAHKYNISQEDLEDANPQMRQEGFVLQKGMELYIPEITRREQTPSNSEMFRRVASKNATTGKGHINMVVLLPFDDKNAGSRMVEFYRGMLLAVEQIKQNGISVDVYALDSKSSINTLLNDPCMEKADIIFAPPSAEQVGLLSDYSKKHAINLVVPFTSKGNEVYSNPYLFMVNAPTHYLNASISGEVIKRYSQSNIVFINAESKTDRADFTKELNNELTNKGIQTHTLNLSASDAQWGAVLNNTKQNLFIPNAENKEALQKILPKMEKLRKVHPGVEIHLFGYPDWQAFSAQKEALHKSDAYIASYYYTTNYDLRDMNATFTKWFGSPMQNYLPRYGLFGYDLALYFLRAVSVYGNRLSEEQLNSVTPALKLMKFGFSRVSNFGGYVNKRIRLVNYTESGNMVEIK